MCLMIDEKKTEKFMKESDGDVKFYKVFVKSGSRLIPLYQIHLSYTEDIDEGGWATATPVEDEVDPGAVYGGAYHGYLEESRAKEVATFMKGARHRGSETVIRSVMVPSSSIVAVGREGDIAFTKMKVALEKGEKL